MSVVELLLFVVVLHTERELFDSVQEANLAERSLVSALVHNQNVTIMLDALSDAAAVLDGGDRIVPAERPIEEVLRDIENDARQLRDDLQSIASLDAPGLVGAVLRELRPRLDAYASSAESAVDTATSLGWSRSFGLVGVGVRGKALLVSGRGELHPPLS